MAFYNIYFPSNSTKSNTESNSHGSINLNNLGKTAPFFKILQQPSFHPDNFSLILISVDHTDAAFPYCFTFFTFDYVFNLVLSDSEFLHFKNMTAAHNHNNYQLTYILSGTYIQAIEQELHSYTTNDVCFLKPEVIHTEDFSKDFSIVTISLSSEYLMSILDEKTILPTFMNSDCIDFLFSSPYRSFDFSKDLRWYFSQSIELMLYPAFANSTVIKAYMSQLFVKLINFPEYKRLLYSYEKNSDFLLFKKITKELKNTHGRITRHELEETLHYSGSYLNKVVQRYSKQNFSHYRASFTLEQTAHLLKTTEKTVCEICDELAIQNRTHFYKQFKEKYGVVPGEYRKKHHI